MIRACITYGTVEPEPDWPYGRPIRHWWECEACGAEGDGDPPEACPSCGVAADDTGENL